MIGSKHKEIITCDPKALGVQVNRPRLTCSTLCIAIRLKLPLLTSLAVWLYFSSTRRQHFAEPCRPASIALQLDRMRQGLPILALCLILAGKCSGTTTCQSALGFQAVPAPAITRATALAATCAGLSALIGLSSSDAMRETVCIHAR